MDTHLTATYVLARQAGFSDEQARLIAIGNWSLDINTTSTALPAVDFTLDDAATAWGMTSAYGKVHGKEQRPSVFVHYWDRGGTFHALGDRESVRNSLVALRAGAQGIQGEREKLIAIGQYLHALQDVSFHQEDGSPYSRAIGHLLHEHDTDKVALHFDAALKAYSNTFNVLQNVRTTGTLPEVPPLADLYRPGEKHVISPEEFKRIREDDRKTGVFSLASAIAGSYEKTNVRGEFKYGSPNPVVLNTNIQRAWSNLHPGDTSRFSAPLRMDKNDPRKFNYETHPELLALKPAPAKDPSPGGISLSMAAAIAMSLNLDLDGSYFDQGRVVLTGRAGATGGIDAALFLTALRLGCEDGDPYFSLDPDDGRAWSDEGDQFAREAWNRIKSEFAGGDFANGLGVRAISVRRDYPGLWVDGATKYPNLKSRLVFRPFWLGETRFGEILYKADVLLKELSGGVPALSLSKELRAAQIDGYVSADTRAATRKLLSGLETSGSSEHGRQWTGSRLWFDLVPEIDGRSEDAPRQPMPNAFRTSSGVAADLRKILVSRGYIDAQPRASVRSGLLVQDGEKLDMSRVYPRMFVRRHDSTTGKDVPGNDPDLDGVAKDVNSRIDLYANTHEELKALTDVFRAYVAAVAMVRREPEMCNRTKALPLLAAEKTSTNLPEHHRTELFITAAQFVYSTGDRGPRRLLVSTSSSLNGGILLQGKSFYDRAMDTKPSAITRAIEQQLVQGELKSVWQDSGRQFVGFSIDSDEVVQEATRLGSFTPATRGDMFEPEVKPLLASAEAYEEKKKYDMAVREYTEAIELDTDNHSIFAKRAAAYELLGKYPEAIRDYTQAVQIEDRHEYFASRASAYQQTGQYDEAIRDYTRAIQQNRDFEQEVTPLFMGFYTRKSYYTIYLNERAEVFINKGDYDRATRDFEKIIAVEPTHTGARSRRCWTLAALGRLAEAMSDCDEALRLYTLDENATNRLPEEKADIHFSRALVYLKMGQFERAVADYDQATAIFDERLQEVVGGRDELTGKKASSLCGRGIAKIRKGDRAGGRADIAAARALNKTVVDEFARLGFRE